MNIEIELNPAIVLQNTWNWDEKTITWAIEKIKSEKMNRATPIQMRKALEAVQALKQSGILFVPIPALDENDHADLIKQLDEKLCQIEQQAE